MKQSLQLRTSQHLALTPQLQQSIRLLQLSTLELHQELEQLLTDNPLLERLDDPLDNSVRLLADGAIGSNAAPGEAAPEPGAQDAAPADADAGEGGDGDSAARRERQQRQRRLGRGGAQQDARRRGFAARSSRPARSACATT